MNTTSVAQATTAALRLVSSLENVEVVLFPPTAPDVEVVLFRPTASKRIAPEPIGLAGRLKFTLDGDSQKYRPSSWDYDVPLASIVAIEFAQELLQTCNHCPLPPRYPIADAFA